MARLKRSYFRRLDGVQTHRASGHNCVGVRWVRQGDGRWALFHLHPTKGWRKIGSAAYEPGQRAGLKL